MLGQIITTTTRSASLGSLEDLDLSRGFDRIVPGWTAFMPLINIHSQNQKNILGREPTPVELHQRTHQRKADHQWVDTRAQKVHEDYTRISEAHRHSSAGESSSGTSQRSEYDLWLEAVGGQKKGRIYGLGSQGVAYGSSSSASPYPGHAQDQLEEMMRRQFASYADEMRSRMSAEIDARVDAAIKARLGKNIVEEEAEEEEEEEDDDDV